MVSWHIPLERKLLCGRKKLLRVLGGALGNVDSVYHAWTWRGGVLTLGESWGDHVLLIAQVSTRIDIL